MTQPEALRLADFLDDQYDPSHNLEEAAAELRRLHDETLMLNSAYESACKIISEQDKKLAELEAVNQELLEALRLTSIDCQYLPTWHKGPPPSIGWWPASRRGNPDTLRWWDGKTWSLPVDSTWTASLAAEAAKAETAMSDIEWTDRPASWPERART